MNKIKFNKEYINNYFFTKSYFNFADKCNIFTEKIVVQDVITFRYWKYPKIFLLRNAMYVCDWCNSVAY